MSREHCGSVSYLPTLKKVKITRCVAVTWLYTQGLILRRRGVEGFFAGLRERRTLYTTKMLVLPCKLIFFFTEEEEEELTHVSVKSSLTDFSHSINVE